MRNHRNASALLLPGLWLWLAVNNVAQGFGWKIQHQCYHQWKQSSRTRSLGTGLYLSSSSRRNNNSSSNTNHNNNINKQNANSYSFENEGKEEEEGIRLNKVFKSSHSRREADRLIQDGRVKVNGKVSYGCMVLPYHDTVQLDGLNIIGWEQINAVDMPYHIPRKKTTTNRANLPTTTTAHFEYIKYWKPRGVTCTTDHRIAGNIVDQIIQVNGYRPNHRVYPVGRLDKDTTGLILLTNDGRLPNASFSSSSLSSSQQQQQNIQEPNVVTKKVYVVHINRRIDPIDVRRLREGVLITTIAQRDRTTKPLTAYTKPCHVTVLSPYTLEMTLTEGRNRQIRKMLDALGYRVMDLHRTKFGNVTLQGLSKPGDWQRLKGADLEWVNSVLMQSQ